LNAEGFHQWKSHTSFPPQSFQPLDMPCMVVLALHGYISLEDVGISCRPQTLVLVLVPLLVYMDEISNSTRRRLDPCPVVCVILTTLRSSFLFVFNYPTFDQI
jgi:hypothetical protein